jgi:hypothetical protein
LFYNRHLRGCLSFNLTINAAAALNIEQNLHGTVGGFDPGGAARRALSALQRPWPTAHRGFGNASFYLNQDRLIFLPRCSRQSPSRLIR